jgi:hypothetical protein
MDIIEETFYMITDVAARVGRIVRLTMKAIRTIVVYMLIIGLVALWANAMAYGS